MNEQNYISLETAKQLKEWGCELESEWCFRYLPFSESEYQICRRDEAVGIYASNIIPVYDILNDICVKYAREFFGEPASYVEYSLPHTVLSFMMEGKKQEAEKYILDNCLFRPTTK